MRTRQHKPLPRYLTRVPQGASLGDTVAPSSQASVDLGGFIESFAFDTVMTSSATVDGSVVVEGGPTLFPLSEAMTSSGASVMGTPLTWQNSSAYSGLVILSC